MAKTNNKNSNRPLWNGFYPRKTKTKREKEISIQKKYKKGLNCDWTHC